MEKYVIIVSLLLSGAIYAQPPRIDSMFVDESKSELQIHGGFGSAKGAVWVDSLQLQIKNWSDSFIVVLIPSSGRGSSGPVVIAGRSLQSNERMLSMWQTPAAYVKGWATASSGGESVDENWVTTWRVDLDDRIRNAQAERNILFLIQARSQGSYQYQKYHGSANTNVRDTSFYTTKSQIFYGSLRMVDISYFIEVLDVNNNSNVYDMTVTLDTALIPQTGSVGTDPFTGVFHWGDRYMGPSSVLFPPPKSVLQLREKPTLVSPNSGTLFSYKDAVLLIWDSLVPMNSYHLEVSSDTLFLIRSIDTVISTITFSLPPLSSLTKYFWRVAGVNSEGESRWSDVWNFTTGATAGVAETQASPFSFSAYPNPATDKLTISYSASQGDVTIALYDLLGNKVRALRQQAEGTSRELPLTGLPAGMYVLELNSAGIHKSMPISILR